VKPVIWEPPARQEVRDALAASATPIEFQRVIEEALQDIASGLTTHMAVRKTPYRRCDLTALPYSIIYAEAANEIRVVAFPHHKRRTNYWKSRLRPPP